jgi:hypothetical protein
MGTREMINAWRILIGKPEKRNDIGKLVWIMIL